LSKAIFITARLKSTRLPRKVLKPILGRPMISHMIERLRLAKVLDRIVICTSPLDEDIPLVESAREEGIEHFCGHPDDVLLRLTDAARSLDIDTVVSCTADNPFVDPEHIDLLLDYHWREGHGFSRTEGLPWGTFAYALERSAMERACEIKDAVDTEVWGGYFTETDICSWGVIRITDPSVRWPELRLTVDTPEDFELVTRIFEQLHRPGEVFSLREIVTLCRHNPDLVRINSSVRQQPAKSIRLKAESGE
jgi:spore coat polysaccharide biosynthesis protein SpsF